MNTLRIRITAISLLAPQVAMTSWSVAGELYADTPPPTPRVEHAPLPRDGYVWGPGHWAWSGKSYYWVSGTWVVQRRHMQWVADRWEQAGDKWRFVQGHWQLADGLVGTAPAAK